MTQRLDCQIFANAAMTADRYSDWLDTRGMSEITFHLSWIGTGTPVGAWKVEVSNDPLCRVELEKEPKVTGASSAAKKVDITSSVTPIHGSSFTVSGGTNGETFFALTGGLPRFVRVWFDHSGGGSAASLLNGWTSGRE